MQYWGMTLIRTGKTRKVEALREHSYQILKAKGTWALRTRLLINPAELLVLVLTKTHVGSGNKIVE